MILASDADRVTYLELLRGYSQLYALSLLGYCLMSNHVHLIAVPQTPQALSQSLKQAHGRYAAYWNAQQSSTGHVWQGRFYSCPLDESHLWAALRYVELNPVRAGMVATPERWRWSSAATHCGLSDPDPLLEMERWRKRWTAAEWRGFIEDGESVADVNRLRDSTHTGRPLGSPDFVAGLEELTSRPLAPRREAVPRNPQPIAGKPASSRLLSFWKKPVNVPSVPTFFVPTFLSPRFSTFFPPSPRFHVEIESQWTARRREQRGVVLLVRAHPPAKSAGRVGQPGGES